MNLHKFSLYVLLALCFSISACAGKRKIYNWCDYSDTLYQCRKNPCEETYTNHKEELKTIIAISQKANYRVPPGVYSELGYAFLKENQILEAIRYFSLEAETYPESKLFMEKLIKAAKLRQEKTSSTSVLPLMCYAQWHKMNERAD